MAEHRYIYAIVAHDAALPPDLAGMMDDPLTTIVFRDLAAVTSAVEGPALPAVAEHVMRHEEIVEAVWRAVPALPVRFGTILSNRMAVERARDRRYDALVADLARLGGMCEFGLSVLWNADEIATPAAPTQSETIRDGAGRGAAYLHARARTIRIEDARRARATTLAETVDAMLRQHALQTRRSLVPTERLALRMAYLVDPKRSDAFVEAFGELRRRHDTHRFLLSGPWPPYTFVSRDESASLLSGGAPASEPGNAWSIEALRRSDGRTHDEA